MAKSNLSKSEVFKTIFYAFTLWTYKCFLFQWIVSITHVCWSCLYSNVVRPGTVRPLSHYRAFHGFGQAKFPYGSLVLGSSQFSILPQLPPKIMLDSKVVKIDPKIMISLCYFKSVTHSVVTYCLIYVYLWLFLFRHTCR